MEDNNAINEQGFPTEVNEENYNKVIEEYSKLQNIATNLYQRVKQLENTWVLQRASFLMEIIKCGKFSSETIIKAEEELTSFLFPKKEKDIKED